jgi:hypothetical protein
MRIRSGVMLVCACLGACGTLPATGDTPYLPPGAFGVFEDNDTAAMNQSSWALASAERTRNDPIDAAKAVIAVEYLAGALRSSPRWSYMASTPKAQMLQARQDLRQVLGIQLNAPPQLVVNALLAMVAALAAGNEPAALQALSVPIFTQPPLQTLARLANLPYVRSANLATMQAVEEEYPSGGDRR